MNKLMTGALTLISLSVVSGEVEAQDDCGQNFIGHVRSQFQSQIAAAEVVKVFVLLDKRVNTPAGTLQMYVTCDAPHVGKGNFTSDPDPATVLDEWDPRFLLIENDPNPIPPREAELDEFYPTTRPFLDQDRSFVQEQGYKVYEEDLKSPQCYYYYSNGGKTKYCW